MGGCRCFQPNLIKDVHRRACRGRRREAPLADKMKRAKGSIQTWDGAQEIYPLKCVYALILVIGI